MKINYTEATDEGRIYASVSYTHLTLPTMQ